MARRPIPIIPGAPHHVTQRASHGAFILEPTDVKAVLANLIADWAARTGVIIHAAVFMNNHFHLSATPPSEAALSTMIGKATQFVSRYINSRQPKGGPNWQSRFYAAPMDPEHAVATARYIERNPVAAGLVTEPWLWPWSTAAFHAGLGKRPRLLTDPAAAPGSMTSREWKAIIQSPVEERFASVIHLAAASHAALGSDAWIERMEKLLGKPMRARGRGRPRGGENQPG